MKTLIKRTTAVIVTLGVLTTALMLSGSAHAKEGAWRAHGKAMSCYVYGRYAHEDVKGLATLADWSRGHANSPYLKHIISRAEGEVHGVAFTLKLGEYGTGEVSLLTVAGALLYKAKNCIVHEGV